MKVSSHKLNSSSSAPLVLCLTVLVMFGIIETVHPYFFFQDDNRSQNLPYFVHNLRALSGGEFPFFNFHQFLGTPTFSCMQSAALYPLNYVALIFSKTLLGHFCGTMEFIALFHLMIAATGFYYFLRRLGLGVAAGFFGGVTWAFCGFVVSVGDSWIFITGIAAWLPWILLFAVRQIFAVSAGSFIVLALLRLLLLFVGHPQFFAYCVLFDLLTSLLLYNAFRRQGGAEEDDRTPVRANLFCLNWVAGYLLVAVAALPLLLPAMHQVSISAARKEAMSYATYIDFSYDLTQWLHGLFSPFTDTATVYFCNQHYISHIGYLTLVFILLAFAGMRQKKYRREIAAFSGLAAFSLLWSADVVFAKLFYFVPYFNRFANPFKVGFFTSFFFIIIAAYGVQILCEHLQNSRRVRGAAIFVLLALGLLLHTGNLLLYHSVTPQKMFSRHFDKIPLEEPLKDVLVGGRIASIGVDEHQFDGYVVYGNSVPTLGFDYATLFGLQHFAGYEVLVSEKNSRAAMGLNYYSLFYTRPDTIINVPTDLPLDYLRKWGVRWYSVDRRIPLKDTAGIQLHSTDSFRRIYLDSAARPYVYWNDTVQGTGTSYSFMTNSVEIASVRPTAGELIINVLYNPFFIATIDGRKAVITETADAQMLLRVPGGNHTVKVTYRDPYFYRGLYITVSIMAVCAFIYGVFRRCRKII